jgi:hypothetical protein
VQIVCTVMAHPSVIYLSVYFNKTTHHECRRRLTRPGGRETSKRMEVSAPFQH